MTIKKIAVICGCVAVALAMFVGGMSLVISMWKGSNKCSPPPVVATTVASTNLQAQQLAEKETQLADLQRQVEASKMAPVAPPAPVAQQTPADQTVMRALETAQQGHGDVVLKLWTGRPAVIHELNESRQGDRVIRYAMNTATKPAGRTAAEVRDDIGRLQETIISSETELSLLKSEVITGNNDPRVAIPRKACIQRQEIGLESMKAQMRALQEELKRAQ
ncbi:MAG: hypothetical protein NT155_03920 [Candidatus Staskawiczbacteria bacterium]|nr:hypothetical protein [Candidatus Staskawiczbacteria bacterium]